VSKLKLVFTAVLFILVFYFAGLFDPAKRIQLIETFSNPNWFWLIISIVVSILLTLLSAFKWWCLIKSADLKVSFFRTWGYYMVGMLYNLFLPTSVGGDAVRSYSLGKYTDNQVDSLASVFVERYTGLLLLLLFSVIALILNLSIFNHIFITISLGGFCLVLAVIGYLAFFPSALRLVNKLFSNKVNFLDKVLGKIGKFSEAVISYKERKHAISIAFLNSFLFYLVAIVNVYVTARVFSSDISFTSIVLATPIIMLLMNIPLSIGNYGVMEFSYVLVFELLGLGVAVGASTAILMRLKTFLDGLIGVGFVQKMQGSIFIK